jgi:hypothetical protein
VDYLTFITKLIEFLAWPIVTLIAALSFRSKIEELIPRLLKAKFKDLEFEFLKTSVESLEAEQKVSFLRVELENASGQSAPPRAQVASAFEIAVREAAELEARKQYLSGQLFGSKLTTGRESILINLVDRCGINRIAAMTETDLVHDWEKLVSEVRESTPYYVNPGAFTGLRSVGIVDEHNQLTQTGAAILNTIARQKLAALTAEQSLKAGRN